MEGGINTRRRQILAAGIPAVTGSISGCSSVSPWTKERTEDQRPRLCQDIVLINYDSEPHVFHVLMERDGEILKWWDSDEIPSNEGEHVELGAWHWQWGHYTVYGSYDEYPEWAVEDLSSDMDGDVACIWPRVEIYHRDEDREMNIVPVAKGTNEYSTPETAENS